MPTAPAKPNVSWPLNLPLMLSILRATGLTVSAVILSFAAAAIFFLMTPLTFITTDMYPDGNGQKSGPAGLLFLQTVLPGFLILIASLSLTRSALAKPDRYLFGALTAPYFFLIFSTLLLNVGSGFSAKTPPINYGIFGTSTFISFPIALVILVLIVSIAAAVGSAFIPRIALLLAAFAALDLLVAVACFGALVPLSYNAIFKLFLIGGPAALAALPPAAAAVWLSSDSSPTIV